MRYYYGTSDSYHEGAGRTASVKQVASIIQRDVEFGKWNIYEGGKQDSTLAKCRYKKNGFIFHSVLIIQGQKKEFKELEKLIQDIVEVIPRQYN